LLSVALGERRASFCWPGVRSTVGSVGFSPIESDARYGRRPRSIDRPLVYVPGYDHRPRASARS